MAAGGEVESWSGISRLLNMTQSAAIIVICNISMGYLLVGAVIFVDIYLFVFNKQL